DAPGAEKCKWDAGFPATPRKWRRRPVSATTAVPISPTGEEKDFASGGIARTPPEFIHRHSSPVHDAVTMVALRGRAAFLRSSPHKFGVTVMRTVFPAARRVLFVVGLVGLALGLSAAGAADKRIIQTNDADYAGFDYSTVKNVTLNQCNA